MMDQRRIFAAILRDRTSSETANKHFFEKNHAALVAQLLPRGEANNFYFVIFKHFLEDNSES